MLMTQMQSIRIAQIMNGIGIAKAGPYTSEMEADVFTDGHPPLQNEHGEWLNYRVVPESWAVDALEMLLVVAEKLDYSNLLNT
jgi:hypothetical protein